MKIFVVIFLILFFTLSCSKKEEKTIDQNLVYFHSKFLAELGDEKYDNLESKLNKKPKVKYLDDDLIYITGYVEANACGQYIGNLKYKNDSIILLYNLVSDEVCTSTSIEKATFIIKNPKSKKYKFRFGWE